MAGRRIRWNARWRRQQCTLGSALSDSVGIVGTREWRLTWWGWLAVAVAVTGVAVAVRLVPERIWWATTLQFIGSSVTAGGLLGAYVRSKHGLTLTVYIRQQRTRVSEGVQRTWARVLRRPRRVTGKASGALVVIPSMFASAVVLPASLQVDTTAPFQVQLAQVAEHVNRLIDRLPDINRRLNRVDQGLKNITNDLETVKTETLARIESEIEQLRERLDVTQVLDLRWAIIGLFITTVGIALSY